MADTTFLTLWENVDHDLHKLMNVLKGAICVREFSPSERDTTLGLVYVALDKLEEAQEGLEALREYHQHVEKEKEKAEA